MSRKKNVDNQVIEPELKPDVSSPEVATAETVQESQVVEPVLVELVNVWPTTQPGIGMNNDGKKLLIVDSSGNRAVVELDRIFNVVITNRAVSFLFK